MNPQLQNWNNFCQYHVGEWHGKKARYSPDKEVIKSWEVVTTLEISENGNTINHKDLLIYDDGTTELKNFGPYTKPILNALFLDNSFLWGSKTVESGSLFIFEIGFRFEDRRMLGYTRYNGSGNLEYISTGTEYLGQKKDKNSQTFVNKTNENWQGKLKKMTPDWIVSEPTITSWKKLENLNIDYLTLHLNDGISISCPQHIENGQEFFIAMDWQVNNLLLQRGIGYYDSSGFTDFTLEVFTASS